MGGHLDKAAAPAINGTPDGSLIAALLTTYRADGHATATGVFDADRMDAAIADVVAWGEAELAAMPEDKRRWYIDAGAFGDGAATAVLRKLDNPHVHREFFGALARDPAIVSLVEAIIGRGVSVYFSQVFFKPPRGGGPKPAHQDNFYFGPSDPDGMVTAWIALEDADEANGCLRYGRASHLGPILPHGAPPEEPFNLQIGPDDMTGLDMRPAPVPKGGVSFHHGATVHRSADNRSDRWRRACALHFVRNDVVFETPALPYDVTLVRRVSEA